MAGKRSKPRPPAQRDVARSTRGCAREGASFPAPPVPCGYKRPIGVADWTKQLTETLPDELKGSLPAIEDIEAELSETAHQAETPSAERQGGDAVRETGPRYEAVDAVRIMDRPFDATGGTDTPFGQRWGGDVVRLTPAHLAALAEGKTLAIDAQNEYIVFVQINWALNGLE